MPRRGGRRARSSRRASTAPRRSSRSTGSPTPSWRRGSRRSTTSAGPRTTSSTTTRRSRTPTAGIAIARATGEGRLLVPLMLVQGLPARDAGPPGRGARGAARRPWRPRACRPTRTTSSGRCSSSAWPRYFAGDLDGAIAAVRGERARRRAARRRHDARRPAAGPGWALGVALLRAGRGRARRFEVMRALGGDELEHTIPVERCFDWEISRSPSSALGTLEAAEALRARAPRRTPPRSACSCPRRWPAATRAAVLLAAGEPRGGASRRSDRPRRRDGDRRAAAGGVLAQPAGPALAAAGDRERGDRGAARGRARARRLRLACACATRCAASCASSARAPRRAGRRRGESGRRRR